MMTMDTRKQAYVIGFAFDLQAERVLLIHKLRGPSVVRGRLNGIGGKIELGESAWGTMNREAEEEAGLVLHGAERWEQFHFHRHTRYALPDGTHPHLSFFCVNVWRLSQRIEQKTDELLEIMSIGNAISLANTAGGRQRFVYNIGFLLPMALAWLENPEQHYQES